MGRFEYLVDLAQRMLLDERRDLDAAVQHELERLWIELRWTAPVPDRAGMERHQVGKPDLDLVHGEADHAQGRAVIEQAECGFLALARAGAFENDPLALP